MGGRGRGRGRGTSMSFNVEQLGFTRGEALPQAAVAPPPTFPPLSTKPLPLISDLHHDYMLAAKSDLSIFWRDSPQFVRPPDQRGLVERYSDRYQDSTSGHPLADRHTDISRIPAELRVSGVAARKRRAAKRSGAAAKRQRLGGGDVKQHLEKLEKKEAEGGESDEEKKDDEGSEQEEAEAADEDEELDEGTDYVNDYFDNGEEYLDAEDDALEEGPVF